MSRIGKNPIKLQNGIEVNISSENLITVKGPKGELKTQVDPKITVEVKENEIVVTRKSDEKIDKALHGLYRSLVANMCEGVTKGFKKELEIIGVGYRAQIQGNKVVLSLGFSHPVEYEVAEGITVTQDQEKKNILIVQGIDKQKVGQVAAEIRAFRKPEPYKGKGVRYVGEYIAMKAGKSASSK